MSSTDSQELPLYRCHKEVRALKIVHVDPIDIGSDSVVETVGAWLLFDDSYNAIEVDRNFVDKHDPQPGGYYVVYKDGYTSFSPAEAFEEGYTKVN